MAYIYVMPGDGKKRIGLDKTLGKTWLLSEESEDWVYFPPLQTFNFVYLLSAY